MSSEPLRGRVEIEEVINIGHYQSRKIRWVAEFYLESNSLEDSTDNLLARLSNYIEQRKLRGQS